MPEILPQLQVALSDRYRLEHEVGRGGMATVYLAQDLRHDPRVAVKVLRPELAAVMGADRFLAEIRTTANLQHPLVGGSPRPHQRGAGVTRYSPERRAPLRPCCSRSQKRGCSSGRA